MKRAIAGLQQLGRSFMLPIAVLPVAGLLLRLGQPDLLDIGFVAAAGNAIFANLGMIFAVGIAIGFARQSHGAAGLAGLIAYLVATNGAKALIDAPPSTLAGLNPEAATAALTSYRDAALSKLSVPIGILCGLLSGLLYNRFANIRLPEILAFFGGRRFVPIASGLAGLLLAALFGSFWQAAESGITVGSNAVVGAGEIGLFLYGALNRLLIVTGMHHILNNVAWFVIGDYEGATGDLRRFFASDPTAGGFMAGFFPVMIFGMPAACLAMWRAAVPQRRKQVGGLYLSMGLTSALTGITEPIEFTFMFLAPALYAIHAILTGAAMVLMDMLEVRLGFGFSAGLIDYALNYGISSRPLLLIPVGLVYFVIYYTVFAFMIRRFDLATPGRERDPPVLAEASARGSTGAAAWLKALGGAANLRELGACTTRLRLLLADPDAIDEPRLRVLGARGIVKLGEGAVQVIVGPRAESLSDEIAAQMDMRAAIVDGHPQPVLGGAQLSEFAVHALGGESNILATVSVPGRIAVTLADPALWNETTVVKATSARHAERLGNTIHILTR